MAYKKKIRRELKHLRDEVAVLSNEIKKLTASMNKNRMSYPPDGHSTYRPSWNDKKW